MKKNIVLITLSCMLIMAFTGCSKSGSNNTSESVSTEATTEVTTEATTEATTQATTEEASTTGDLFEESGFATFELSSEDLHDGAWDPAIASIDNGTNSSPQLSWEPVPEATCYVIYMIDTSADNWLHWKSNNVTETTLPQGWASTEEYVGPYPPGGTHNYDIYVFALREPVERAKGTLNNPNSLFYNNAMALDSVEEGSSGNIISYGYLPGTYTKN